MKLRQIVLALLLVLLAGPIRARAQEKEIPVSFRLGVPLQLKATTPHSVTLTWTTTVSGSTTTVSRASCSVAITAGVCPTASEGAFAVISTTPVASGTSTYVDSTVAANTNYSYYVQSVCVAPACGSDTSGNQYSGTSVASNHVGAAVPANQTPPPPPTLNAPTIVINLLPNGMDRLQADWTDTPGATTAFTIFGAQGQVLRQGSQTGGLGTFEFVIQIPPQSGSMAVCDSSTCVNVDFKG